MAISESDLIDGSEITDKSGTADGTWIIPVYKPDGTEEGGLTAKAVVNLTMKSIATAADARTLASSEFDTAMPVFVGDTMRWYRYVANRTSVEDDGSDVIFVGTGQSLQAITYPTWRAAGAGFKEYKFNPYDDIDDTALHSTILLTSSSGSWVSSIGKETHPVGVSGSISQTTDVDAEQETPWTDDTGYVTGFADVSTVMGGYDHTNNQLAGTLVGGGHNFLPYNASGHSTIVGGSNSKASGAYAFIGGGSQNTIGAESRFGAIVGGTLSVIQGDHAGIVGGLRCRIATNGAQSVILGGEDNRIEEDRSVILGGRNNTAKDYFSVLSGDDGRSETGGAHVMSSKALTQPGDCQTFEIALGIRTTSASSANMSGVLNQNLTLGNDYDASVVLKVLIVARDEATGDTAAYSFEGVCKWDGTTYHLYKGGAGGTSEPAMDELLDQIGVASTPTIAATLGQLRPRVYGKASTNIKWSGRMTAAVVRV